MIIPVKTATDQYNIVLERGALAKAAEYMNLNRKVLIVTDEGVPAEYAESVALQCKEPVVIIIPQGEVSKSFENYKMLLSVMIDNDFTRSDCVVAVGGGVVGDLSGFVAASFMRGIDFYNIPTTVLSQVDSSIGGKVAIDFDGYKNIVGAFYPPKLVLIDSDTLKTLPERQISNGLAESVKMSMTSDAKLFELFENENIYENIDKIIEASLIIKKNVVETDEKELGLRKILNFGHTLAHAIETQNNMQNFYHGECVALGMLPMCSGIVKERLIRILEKIGLPTETYYNTDVIIDAIKHDKKMSGEEITVIYVEKVGSYEMKRMLLNDLAKKIKEVNG